jgi:hypothetical protein
MECENESLFAAPTRQDNREQTTKTTQEFAIHCNFTLQRISRQRIQSEWSQRAGMIECEWGTESATKYRK